MSIRDFGNNFIKSDKWFFELMRAGLVSQAASWVDLFTGFALFAWVGLGAGISAAIGAVVGGVINCYINFHFTFHVHNYSWKPIIVKYIMVWLGSVTFNSLGTEGLYFLLQKWQWLETIGFKPDGYYTAARLIVSGVVSLFWNLLLQARFVYRQSAFDPTAILIFDRLTFNRFRNDDLT
ncbi:MAG: GtrA family protein [Bacteroides sp.]|nr:GtrA family protein [Bacteroides sp.]MCM1413838.1 GtrA family protein [Bacteroides sp.]MCM1472399.1 GtrA family protein [Bacteroides sp.]